MSNSCYLSKIKKIPVGIALIDLKILRIRNSYISEYGSINYWKGYNYKGIALRNTIKTILFSHSITISRVYINENGINTCIFIENIQLYINTNLDADYQEHENLYDNERKILLNSIFTTGFFILAIIYNKNVQIIIYNKCLNYEDKNLPLEKIFEKDKRQSYFIPVTQGVEAIFNENASTELLAHLINKYTKQNPNRVYFLSFLKRVIEWYYFGLKEKGSRVNGIRAEIKGRFNAKSRAKKQILSVGYVKKYENSRFIDYKQTIVVTKFGSLGVKIWISFKNNVPTKIKRKI